MKVISGKLKGRTIKGFDLDGTRPTMDRVKESLFASIQDYIKDATCLDLFAGSGNLGIEAISMGANYVYFVDKNKKATQTIKENIISFQIEKQAHLLHKDFKEALSYYKEKEMVFDIIFLDPPYQTDFIKKAISLILEYNLLKKGSILVCESDDLSQIVYNKKLKSLKSKIYGDKVVEILVVL